MVRCFNAVARAWGGSAIIGLGFVWLGIRSGDRG